MDTETTDLRHRIEHDRFAQHPPWWIQNVGWSVMVAVVVAALIGVFGNGPLSRAEMNDDEGRLTVQYPRLARSAATSELRFVLRVEPGAQLARLSLAGPYVEHAGIERVTPAPVRVEQGRGWVVYWFPLDSPAERVVVTVHIKPPRGGFLEGAAMLDGTASVAFHHFLYP